jgi:hypothetical protein
VKKIAQNVAQKTFCQNEGKTLTVEKSSTKMWATSVSVVFIKLPPPKKKSHIGGAQSGRPVTQLFSGCPTK